MTLKKETPVTVTRSYLADVVHRGVGVPLNEASDIVEYILDQMVDGVVKDGSLKLSSFGSFTVRQKKARIGRNPKTKVEAKITERQVVRFSASNVLKSKINSKKK